MLDVIPDTKQMYNLNKQTMMKKTILFFAVALLFCGGLKAQDLADASSLNPTFQLSLTDGSQYGINSIYALPMPESDMGQAGVEQYASRKGWGIFCIVSGATTMLGGISVWVFGGMFSNTVDQVGQMSGFPDDPDMQQGQEIASSVGNGVKTIGIIATAAGAALVGTGIWLVSSDGGSSRGGRRGHGVRGKHRTFSEDVPTIEPIRPDWALSFNVSPVSSGLTLHF